MERNVEVFVVVYVAFVVVGSESTHSSARRHATSIQIFSSSNIKNKNLKLIRLMHACIRLQYTPYHTIPYQLQLQLQYCTQGWGTKN
jgi:hypothetical protein